MTIIRASTGSLRLFHFKLTSFILLIGLIDQTNMEMFLDLSTLEGFLMMGEEQGDSVGSCIFFYYYQEHYVLSDL